MGITSQGITACSPCQERIEDTYTSEILGTAQERWSLHPNGAWTDVQLCNVSSDEAKDQTPVVVAHYSSEGERPLVLWVCQNQFL